MQRQLQTLPLNKIKLKPEYQSEIPRPSPQQFEDLQTSIQRRGILDELTINQNSILIDGYSRYNAAYNLDLPEVPVKIIQFESESEELLFIHEVNRRRRHEVMNAHQRNKEAKRTLELEGEVEKARQRKLKNLKNQPSNVPIGTFEEGSLAEKVAKIADTSTRSAARSLKVMQDPEIDQQVSKGEKSLSAGEKEVIIKERQNKFNCIGKCLQLKDRNNSLDAINCSVCDDGHGEEIWMVSNDDRCKGCACCGNPKVRHRKIAGPIVLKGTTSRINKVATIKLSSNRLADGVIITGRDIKSSKAVKVFIPTKTALREFKTCPLCRSTTLS